MLNDVPFEAAFLRAAVHTLGQIRQEFRRHLPEATAARIKPLENRLMFAQANVPGQHAPTTSDVQSVLDEIHEPGHFRFHFHDCEELLTFVAALSRKNARDRTNAGGSTPPAWLLRDAAGDADAVVLNETA